MNSADATGSGFRLVRAGILVTLLLLWTALLILPLINFTVFPGRNRYLLLSREIGWKTGFLQGSRGRILDRDGQPLAWSERRFDLLLTRIPPASRQPEIDHAMQMIFLRRQPALPAVPGLIKSDLTPDEVNRYAAISERVPELHLKTELNRCLAVPALAPAVGRVSNKNGILSGISGAEEKFDRRLRGRIGFFTVMTDRNGNWIPATWESLRMPEAGQDVTLNRSREELSGLKTEKRSNAP